MKNIVLTGMMGAGKTTVAQRLARNLEGYTAVDTDILIEFQENLSISKIFEEFGEDYFRKLEHKVIKKIFSKDNFIVSIGGGAFDREENRNIILRYSVGIGNYDDLRRNVLGDDIISIIDTVKNDL